MQKEEEKKSEGLDEAQLAEAVLRAEKDPVFFSEAFLNLHPYPYQEAFLTDSSKRIVICAGRRIGKSAIIAARALWFALMNKEQNYAHNFWDATSICSCLTRFWIMFLEALGLRTVFQEIRELSLSEMAQRSRPSLVEEEKASGATPLI